MLNRVILMGRLCADPEFRLTLNNVAVCRIRVAVDRRYSKNGERSADFISVECWRQTAEFVNRYFQKGSMIVVEGSLRNNDYLDKNGSKHFGMLVQAENVSFGESKRETQGQAPNAAGAGAATATPAASQPLSVGDLGEFEDILSDGEVPFM